MPFINEYEAEDLELTWRSHPVMAPATRTLWNLIDVVNENSDGWAYWTKPQKAAARLMAMIDAASKARYSREGTPSDDDLMAAYRRCIPTLKRFRTTSGLQFKIETPEGTE